MTKACFVSVREHETEEVVGIEAFLENLPTGGARLHLIRGENKIVTLFESNQILESIPSKPQITILPHKDGMCVRFMYRGEAIQATVPHHEWKRLCA